MSMDCPEDCPDWVIAELTNYKKACSLDDFILIPCLDSALHQGICAFYFKNIPECRLTDEHEVSENKPFYIGVASERAISERISDHYKKTAAESTLRLSLGVLLQKEIRSPLRRVADDSPKFSFDVAGEDYLNIWMNSNVLFCYVKYQNPNLIKEDLIKKMSPPLNITHSNHPFSPKLKKMRKDAKDKAKGLPPLK